ncbi:hypothetical protein PHMEG_00034727 [Phytophthora megakarya]|uniref:Uncharacterized protein n=1 Tax=Phytophthora megakarya TaxID=4795 RepID=A0A225UQD9_9STRA|nr:hypothetical protein PHMEG_00034727 [Phytophthora megakarya]
MRYRQTRISVLSPQTFNGVVDADFDEFCCITESFLKSEHAAAFGLNFLTLMHAWIAFIDQKWVIHHIALIATVKNDGHTSKKIKDLIETGCETCFNLDITTMVKFTISDTAPAAKKVSKEFDTTLATDCTMHVLNLCILYGLGLRESRHIKFVVNQDSGYRIFVVLGVTPHTPTDG